MQNLSENLTNKPELEKKNPIIFMREKYVKGYFALSHLLVNEFLLFNVLF